jgi:hypothetical protein
VLLVAFALLLVACVAVRAHNVAKANRQVAVDRRIFKHYARATHGRFPVATVTQRKLTDLVCASRHGRPRYKLCIVVAGREGHPHVTSIFSPRSRG